MLAESPAQRITVLGSVATLVAAGLAVTLGAHQRLERYHSGPHSQQDAAVTRVIYLSSYEGATATGETRFNHESPEKVALPTSAKQLPFVRSEPGSDDRPLFFEDLSEQSPRYAEPGRVFSCFFPEVQPKSATTIPNCTSQYPGLAYLIIANEMLDHSVLNKPSLVSLSTEP